MRGGNCQSFERSKQPNTEAGVSSFSVEDADLVVALLLCRNSWTRFGRHSEEVHRKPERSLMLKTFKYRLYPNQAQTDALTVQLSEACRLYDAALQERIEAYAAHRKSINYYDQAAQLTEIRKAGDLGLPNCHCAQEVLKRLEKAFKAFFQRLQRGQKPGFPRFKSRRRYDSITFPSHGDGNKLLSSGHLFVQGVGNIKVKLHRPVFGHRAAPERALVCVFVMRSHTAYLAQIKRGCWHRCWIVFVRHTGRRSTTRRRQLQ